MEAGAAVDRFAETRRFVGFLCLSDKSGFEGRFAFNERVVTTRAIHPVRELVGVTGGDLHQLVGPGGINELGDPARHPFVRNQLAAAGLRGLASDPR